MAEARRYVQSFGRRTSRSLTEHKKQLYAELLPSIAPDASELSRWKRVALEIGFGGGEHVYHAASQDAETLYIGAEPYRDGVVKLLCMQHDGPLDNLRVFADDARLLMDGLPRESLDQCYVLFPDPWPKTRHHKRRLIQKPFLDQLYGLLKPEGKLLLATDHRDYSVWMLEQMLSDDRYRWSAERAADWMQPPEVWTQTRYEEKTGAEGREPVFLEFVKL